jgi:hypothetical protein
MTHITIDRVEAQQILDALEWLYPRTCKHEIANLKQALAATVQDTEAHYKGVVQGVQKLFDDKRAQPVQEPVARVSLQWLAEMILSDCGHSSNYTPLLDRVKARIEQWERANSAPNPPPAAPVPLTPEQRKNLWVSATIESPSHENCYYRGIADSEAYHGITKGQI